MCGRYGEMADGEHWRERFGTSPPPERIAQPQLAPTEAVAVVAQGSRARMVRWGLIPDWAQSWAEAKRKSVINARIEGLASHAMFRSAVRHRVLVPATHYFEWQRDEAGSHPFLVRRRDRDMLAMAGIESRWQDPESGEVVHGMAIVTTAATGALAALHSRMPVVIPAEQEQAWMSDAAAQTVLAELRPVGFEALTAVPVGRAVNSVRQRGVEILQETGPALY